MIHTHEQEFPFLEIRKGDNGRTVINDGDYFDTVAEAMEYTGKSEAHVWSVTECDGTYCYGPSHHWVNLLGFVVTDQAHDGQTYYEETPDMGEECEA